MTDTTTGGAGRLVSLCSGYGGLDLAVEDVLGAETVAYSEVDPSAAAVFARHWPDARALGDLTTVDWTTVQADVVCAGFPCQDLSYAGRGAGITKDSRSGLWYAIEHALGVLRPRYVVLENVAAIVARRPGLDVVLAGLAGLGFDAEWACVRASDVGAPHRRERWFLVAATDPDGGGPRQRCPTEGRRTIALDGLRDQDASYPGSEGRGGERYPVRGGAPRPGTTGRPPRDDEGRVEWGDYGPAIARWERVLGRCAPAPTDERGRLSPEFVEWTMGLSEGWVTSAGLARSQALGCLGNGVVPQQAAWAVAGLLDRVDER